MKLIVVTLVALSLACATTGQSQGAGLVITHAATRPSGVAPAENFTGTVRVQPLFDSTAMMRAFGASVSFDAGARTAWHMHPRGQDRDGRSWARAALGRPDRGDSRGRRGADPGGREALAWRRADKRNDAHRYCRVPRQLEHRVDGEGQRRTIQRPGRCSPAGFRALIAAASLAFPFRMRPLACACYERRVSVEMLALSWITHWPLVRDVDPSGWSNCGVSYDDPGGSRTRDLRIKRAHAHYRSGIA